jgi:UDP-N-acetylglucosamine 3-dehydrogenase
MGDRGVAKIQVAVIGLGIGKTHADRYAKIAGAELVAVCDLDAGLAREVAEQHRCAAYRDPEEMLDEARVDAVSLCTPPRVHPRLVETIASRGGHILVEKPMASTVAGCQEMIESARKHSVTLMLGHKKRFAPPFVRLRELTTPDGMLGPIRQVTLKYMHPGMSPKDWFWSEDDGGGPILENHVHAADTLGFLVGAPIRVSTPRRPTALSRAGRRSRISPVTPHGSADASQITATPSSRWGTAW